MIAVVVATCSNSVKDAGETDTDCGGSCGATCANGKICSQGSDCVSDNCINGLCAAPSCTDSVQNQDETDVDCGGTCGSTCADGETCSAHLDCSSSNCAGSVCSAPSCTDGTENGDETDVDCGGPCNRCSAGEGCGINSDCVTTYCSSSICALAPCTDGIQNGNEEGVDCDGGCPDACPTCSDGIQNGDEDDVDCGGSQCPACELKCSDETSYSQCSLQQPKYCAFGTLVDDCSSCGCPNAQDVCLGDGSCGGAGTCFDNIQNQGEIDVDCGGPCDDCPECFTDGECNIDYECDGGECVYVVPPVIEEPIEVEEDIESQIEGDLEEETIFERLFGLDEKEKSRKEFTVRLSLGASASEVRIWERAHLVKLVSLEARVAFLRFYSEPYDDSFTLGEPKRIDLDKKWFL